MIEKNNQKIFNWGADNSLAEEPIEIKDNHYLLISKFTLVKPNKYRPVWSRDYYVSPQGIEHTEDIKDVLDQAFEVVVGDEKRMPTFDWLATFFI